MNNRSYFAYKRINHFNIIGVKKQTLKMHLLVALLLQHIQIAGTS
jgi:predicted transport protein